MKFKKTKIVLIGEEGSPQRKVNVTFTDNELIIQGKNKKHYGRIVVLGSQRHFWYSIFSTRRLFFDLFWHRHEFLYWGRLLHDPSYLPS